MIEIKNLSYQYDKRFYSLYNVNLNIKESEKILFFTENQLETFTLFRILSKQYKSYEGTISINQKDLKSIPIKNIDISYITSTPYLLKFKSIIYNLAYPLIIRKTKKRIAFSIAKEILEKYNLKYLVDKKIKNLSYLEKIILTLLRAKMTNKSIILIDDIFSNLTTNDLNYILNLIYQLFKGKTILISTIPDLKNKFPSYIIYQFKNGSLE